KAHFSITPLFCLVMCKLCFCTYSPRTSCCPTKTELARKPPHPFRNAAASEEEKVATPSPLSEIKIEKLLQICNRPKFCGSKKCSYIAPVSRKRIFLTPLYWIGPITVNQRVAGSSPASGANKSLLASNERAFL